MRVIDIDCASRQRRDAFSAQRCPAAYHGTADTADDTDSELSLMETLGLPIQFTASTMRHPRRPKDEFLSMPAMGVASVQRPRRRRRRHGALLGAYCDVQHVEGDGLFYPAQILSASHRDGRLLLDVCFVGYGTLATVDEAATRPLSDEFVPYVRQLGSDASPASTSTVRQSVSGTVEHWHADHFKHTRFRAVDPTPNLAAPKYRAETVMFHGTDVPAKYWMQRNSLWSRFAQGVLMDAESWFSVTPEDVAAYIAQRYVSLISRRYPNSVLHFIDDKGLHTDAHFMLIRILFV